MENTAEMGHEETKPQNKRGFWGWFVIGIRSLFILLFMVVLLGGLYFKAPWKILVVDGLLLALLTVVPKPKRKYGWLTLAAAVLAVTVWIFIPEKDTRDWRPYTFDEELAVLEAERIVSPEDDAAPLYEDLFQRWKKIQEDDPFPEEADDECVTQSQPWTAEEFPEVAAWFERHEDFFDDLIAATQKPACYFPAAVTSLELSESMEKLSPVKHFARHLIRASYLDLGESNKVYDALQKQMAVYNLGRHMNQQPMLIDMLVGVAAEAMAYDALKKTLIEQPFPEDIMIGDFLAMTTPIRMGHFDNKEKWKQILAYEKLLAKNTYGKFYEVNPEGKIRFTHFKSLMDYIQAECPDEEFAEISDSYWRGVSWKFSRFFMWLSGQLNDPVVLSEWVDEAYDLLGEALQNEDGSSGIDAAPIHFELNYKYMIKRIAQILLPSFKRIQGDIIPKVRTQKYGTVVVCDLVLYKKQHGWYPDVLDELWQAGEDGQTVSEIYAGFVYNKTNDSFKLSHVGQNGIDEKGHYKKPDFDPNDITYYEIMELKPKPDDILIWPDELENSE